MKKITYLVITFLLIFTSCSEDPEIPSSDVLLKKTIETLEDSSTFTTNYIYNGNKLIGFTFSDERYGVVTYTGNLVTKEEVFDAAGIMLQKHTFEYNGDNQLIKLLRLDYEISEADKYTYVHNSDQTINYEYFRGGLTSQNFEYDGKIFANKVERNLSSPTNTKTYTYTFDGKNNPLKNVLGIDKINFAGSGGSTNFQENMVSNMHTDTLGLSEMWFTYTYTYNSDNYPITRTGFFSRYRPKFC